MDYDIRIERVSQGYELTLRDPEIVKKNKARDTRKSTDPYIEWQDPCREFVLKDKAALLKFLDENIDKALPKSDYVSSFDAAVAAANAEDGDE